jgi:hypothetical protein
MGFKLLFDLKEEARRNKVINRNKELKTEKIKDKIKNPEKNKVDERLENLEKAVHFLLEKVGGMDDS